MTTLPPQIAVPTLVPNRTDMPVAPIGLYRELAPEILGARFVVTRGEPGLVWNHAETSAVEEFLAAKGRPAAPSGLATILSTDVESSTALTQPLGDARAQELVRRHNTIFRDAMEVYGTASKRSHELVSSLGATPIDYRTEDFVVRIRALSGEGVDAVFDPIGGARQL